MLSEQEQIRRKKLELLQELGINPYPAEPFLRTHKIQELRNLDASSLETLGQVSLAGRIMGIREMGKAAFLQIQDATGRVQLYLKRDNLNEATLPSGADIFEDLFKRCLDIGDIIGVQGEMFHTKTGELSLRVRELKLLCKSLRPLPVVKEKQGEFFDEVSDPEFRYRQRYVDLIIHPEVRKVFVQRTQILQGIREFCNKLGFLEVETPILQTIPGGANARPFITHHNALDIPLYLRIANELYLKRLLVGGFEGVYEFAKNFRNEGMDRTHSPEFTGFELYVAYQDYFYLMQWVEELLATLCKTLHGKTECQVGENTINFAGPYRRLTIQEALQEYAGENVLEMSVAELLALCKAKDIVVENHFEDRAVLLDEIFSQLCEPNLLQPTFIIDYPVDTSPLTKKHRSKPGLVERFELYVNGKELANAYSELNDPLDQRQRFEQQALSKEKGNEEAMTIDHDFLRALEYGMPPTAGIGIGIDRLVMFLCNQPSIQDVLLFPPMRPEKF